LLAAGCLTIFIVIISWGTSDTSPLLKISGYMSALTILNWGEKV